MIKGVSLRNDQGVTCRFLIKWFGNKTSVSQTEWASNSLQNIKAGRTTRHQMEFRFSLGGTKAFSTYLSIRLLPNMAKCPAEVGQKKRQQGVHFKEPGHLMLLAGQVAWKQNQLGYPWSNSCHSDRMGKKQSPKQQSRKDHQTSNGVSIQCWLGAESLI